MIVSKETIEWRWINESMPDDETTVLTFCVDQDEPVWLGYHDGDCWHSVDGGELTGVSFWAHIPQGPLPKKSLTDLRKRLTPRMRGTAG